LRSANLFCSIAFFSAASSDLDLDNRLIDSSAHHSARVMISIHGRFHSAANPIFQNIQKKNNIQKKAPPFSILFIPLKEK
jgi:hypothetical protein